MSITEEAIKALVKTEATQASNVALASATPDIEGKGLVALSREVTVHDLEDKLPLRRRARGLMETDYVGPFAQYAATHAEPGATVFVKANDMSATAVLNFGTIEKAGQCDNLTRVSLKKTAPYSAMLSFTDGTHNQREFSEWLEEWGHLIVAREGIEPDAPVLDMKQCITAIRNVTVDEKRSTDSTVGNFSQNRSVAEEIAMRAKAGQKIPPFLHMTFKPYAELLPRTFVIRVGSITNRDTPIFRFQVIAYEQHQEEMANEFADVVRQQFAALQIPEERVTPTVLLGSYNPKR